MYCTGISYNGKGRVAATSTDNSFKYPCCTLRIKWEQYSKVQILEYLARSCFFLNLITTIFSTSFTAFISQLSLAPAGLVSQVGTSTHSTPDSTNSTTVQH